MKKSKWLFFMFLLLFIGACAEKPHEMGTKQTFRFNTANDPESLLPQIGIDQTSRVIVSSIFEGLTRPSAVGPYELGVAKSIDISPDKTRYTFHLRKDFWSDGSKLTAFDFERSWKSAVAPDSLFPRADAFYIIKNAELIKQRKIPLSMFGAKAIDDETFVVDLEHPSPYFLNLITATFFAPFCEGNRGVEVLCNGPFRPKLWEPSKRIVLEKNPFYWDAVSVQLQKVEAFFVDDAQTGYMLFEKGKVDWVGSPFRHLPIDAISRLRQESKLDSKPVSIVYWISLNTQDPVLSNTKLRRALSLAIDREKLAEHVLYGQIPSYSVIPKQLRLQPDEFLVSNEDPKKLFSEALIELGMTKEELSPLTLKHSNVPGQKKLSEALQQIWEGTFGIEVHLCASDWNNFFSDLQSQNYQIGGCLWRCLFDDPICSLEFFKESVSPYNPSGWENEHFKQLLESADEELDLEKRKQMLCEAEKILSAQMPAIALYSELFKFVKRDNVKGVYITNSGDVDLKWAYIE